MEHLNIAQLGVEPLSLLKRFAPNLQGRDFVVGDLHGCRAMFDRLLADIGFDKDNDRMFATGGLINHGPDSIGCLNLLSEPWFHSVAGAHEKLLLSAVSAPGFNWQSMVARGGTWATTIDHETLLDLADRVANLPLAIVVGEGAGRFNVIHAEFHGSDIALEDALDEIDTSYSVPSSLTHGRSLIDGSISPSEHEGLSTTFCGHTIVKEVSSLGSHIFMETGAYRAEREGAGTQFAMTIVEPETGLHWRSRHSA